MAQTIKLKRSSVSGNTPSTSDLELGEVAINTHDGKMFIKKNDGSDSIVEIGGSSGTVTDAFKTIAVSGQTSVVADSATDTLTFVAGTNMTITTNAGGDTITFASTGSSGSSTFLGLSDSPANFSGAAGKYLKVNSSANSIEFDTLNFDDLGTTPTTIAGYGITDALQLGTSATTALAGNTSIPSALTDLSISDGSSGQVLQTDGSGGFSFVNQTGGNSFGTIAVSGQSNVVADQGSDTLTLVAGSNVTLTTNAGGDSVTIASSGSGSSAADAIFEEYQFNATGGQTTFTGSDNNSQTLSYTADAIQVFLNGVFLDPAVDYTATNGTSIVLAETVDANDYLQIIAYKKKISDGQTTVDTFSGNGSTTAFTLSLNPGDENNTRVFIDGVYQSKSNYAVSGTTLTFSTAPPNGTAVEVEIGNRVVTLDTTASIDLPDNVRANFGGSNDLRIYHDSFHSYLYHVGTGDLRIRGNDLLLQNDAGEDYLTATSNGAVSLYYDNNKKIETTNTGVTITGAMTSTGDITANAISGTSLSIDTLSMNGSSIAASGNMTLDVVGDIILDADGGDIRFSDGGTQFGLIFKSGNDLALFSNISDGDLLFRGNDGGSNFTALTLDMSDSGAATFNSNIKLGDNGLLRLGDGNDLQLYHDGSSNIIQGSSTFAGTLYIQAKAGQSSLTATANGNTTLHHSGNLKLETTSTGATITGHLRLNSSGSSNPQIIFNNNDFSPFDWFFNQDDTGKLTTTVTGTGGAEMQLYSDGSDYTNATLHVGGSRVVTTNARLSMTTGAITVDHTDGTDNISLTPTSTGGVINARNSSGTSVVVMDGRGTPFIDVTGNLKTGGTTRIDSSGNLSSIGTISSGAITSSGAVTTTNSNGFVINNIGRMKMNSNNLYIETETNGTGIVLNSRTGFVTFQNNGSTAFQINSSNNATFQGTISSGNITSTGTISGITISANNSSGYGNIEVGGSSGGLIDLKKPFSDDYDMRIVSDGGTGGRIQSNGDFDVDAAGNIVLDADGGEIQLKDGGTEFGQLVKSGNDFRINQAIQDGDIVFRGNDGGSIIQALTLDMSAAGAATFNGTITSGDITINGQASGVEGGQINLLGVGSIEDINIDNYDGIFRIFDASNPQVRLSLNSAGNATFAGTISSGDGSQSAPTYTFSTDTNTGMYRNSENILGFATGGARRGYFASSGLHSDSNVYTGTGASFRNYAGTWSATTGLTGNGFNFINSVDGTAMTLSSTGNMVVTGTISSGAITSSGALKTQYDRSDVWTDAPNWTEQSWDTLILHNANSTTSANQMSSIFMRADGGGNASSRIILRNDNSGNGRLYFMMRSGSHTGTQQPKMLITDDGLVTISDNATTYNERLFVDGNLRVEGVYKSGTQTIIDASRNLTNIGTISSGAITSSGNITAPKFIMTGGSQIGQDYAYLKSNSTTNASLTLRKDSTGADSIDFLQLRSDGNGLIGKIEGDGDISFKNATLSGTISSGAITSSGTITTSGNFVGAGINSTANYTELGTSTASNLVFKRNNAAYIQADTSGGYFIFVTNGRSTSYANRALALSTDNHAYFGGDIHSAGNVTITDASGGSYFKAVQSTNGANAGYYMSSGSSIWYTLVDTSGRYQIYDGDAAAIRVLVDGSGNIGIGTSGPGSRLHIKSASRGSVALRVTDSDTTSDILRSGSQADGDGYLQLRTVAGAGNVLFDASGVSYVTGGNFGISTTAPQAKLELNLHSGATSSLMNANTTNDVHLIRAGFGASASTTSNAGAKWGLRFVGRNDNNYDNTKSGAIYAVSEDSGAGYNRKVGLAFHTSPFDASNIERMRIDSIGNVGIGTTTPGHLLHVHKPSSGDAALMLETVTGGDPTIIFNSAAANRNGLIKFQDNGTNVGRIQYVHNGDRIDFHAGSATGTTLSIAEDKVGIGETNPLSPLVIKRTDNTAFNAADTTGQDQYGATLAIQNLSDTNNSFSQLLLRNRNSSKAVSRIASLTNGTGTDMVFVVENQGSNPGEVMRINKEGEVGIGLANSIDARLAVSGEMRIHSAAAYITHLNYNNTGTHYISQANSGSTTIRNSSNSLVSVTSGGNISFHQAGAGINFSNAANSNAGATSSVLDDYEEGTYTATPTVQSGTVSIDPSYDQLAYTKIGRNVTISGRIRLSTTSASGYFRIALPFAVANNLPDESDFGFLDCVGYGVGTPAEAHQTFAECSPGVQYAVLLYSRDNASWTYWNANNFSSGDILYLSGTYMTT